MRGECTLPKKPFGPADLGFNGLASSVRKKNVSDHLHSHLQFLLAVLFPEMFFLVLHSHVPATQGGFSPGFLFPKY